MRFLGKKDTRVFIFGITLLIVSLRVNANLCLHHGLKVFLPFLKSITLYTFHLLLISFLLLTFSKCVHLCLPIEISVARVTPLISLNMTHIHGRKFKQYRTKWSNKDLSDTPLSDSHHEHWGERGGPPILSGGWLRFHSDSTGS